MAEVEPVKSAAAITSGGHSGCARICRLGLPSRSLFNSSAVEGSGPSPAGQELVGDQDHPVDAKALDHLHGIGGRAADVAFGLHLGRSVDISDDRHTGVT